MTTLLNNTKPLTAEEREELLALRAEKARRDQDGNAIKISEKGVVCLYGTGRRPVSLYVTQWIVVLKNIKALVSFIKANLDKVSYKDADAKEKAAKFFESFTI